ncbi:MAG: hypothetical protein ABIB98_02755 [bacterium]
MHALRKSELELVTVLGALKEISSFLLGIPQRGGVVEKTEAIETAIPLIIRTIERIEAMDEAVVDALPKISV